MQSQTTFVGLVEDDGLLLPRVKKQKIWVEAVSYELQEIYGMEQAASSARTKEVRGAGRFCCIACLQVHWHRSRYAVMALQSGMALVCPVQPCSHGTL